jgi:hypothetical protein
LGKIGFQQVFFLGIVVDVFAIQLSGRIRRVYVPAVIAPAGRFGVNGFVDDVGTDRVELYTGPYAERYPKEPATAIKPYIQAAETARKNGLSVNAGHDLNLHNLPLFYRSIPFTEEVSIGHALMVDALLMGLENSIKSYKNCLK